MEHVTIGPNRIAYERTGSGPPLLLIHGWPFSHASFDAIRPTLAEHFTCYAPDTPGLGVTEWSENTDFNFRAQARTFQALADALDLAEYRVLAHDTGATIARVLASADRRVKRLVVLNTEMPGHRPPWIPLYQQLTRLPGSAI